MKVVVVSSLIFFLATFSLAAEYTKFPEGFKFGVATASHQIEGAWNTSGKSENVWDHLSHTRPELIADGTNGDITIDSYHKYPEDVEALKYLGVDFYRFSLSWARILPTGRIDHINQEGVEYYNKLLDLLQENKIESLATLYHWDLPQVLQDLGGWSNPYMIDYFEDYSRLCFSLFGDRIKSWITFNEPWEVCEDGYGDINKAPAINSHGVGNYLCGDNLLKAHAKAYHIYDKEFRPTQKGSITISINSIWYAPEDPSDQSHVDLAMTANQFKFGWFAHPIYTKAGGYPKVMIEQIGNRSKEEGLVKSRLPEMSDEWKALIRGTADTLGINHYTTHLVKPGMSSTTQSPSWLKDIGAIVNMEVGKPSASVWLRVYPKGFGDLLRWVKAEYDDPEVLITENGFSDRGGMEDDDRISYFTEYMAEMLKAIYEDGVHVTCYTAWTLADNFEWRAGFSERFGLHYVDITNPELKRVKKKSADFFKKLIADRELPKSSASSKSVSKTAIYCILPLILTKLLIGH